VRVSRQVLGSDRCTLPGRHIARACGPDLAPECRGRGPVFQFAYRFLIDFTACPSRDQARLALFHWIEGFYDCRRRRGASNLHNFAEPAGGRSEDQVAGAILAA